VDASGRVTDFEEKPKTPEALARVATDPAWMEKNHGIHAEGRPYLASMGIYAFTADFMYEELQRDHETPGSSRDFGKDVIPSLVSRGLAVAHRFENSCVTTIPDAEPYWRDVGTIDAYWAANLDLVMPTPQLDIYDRNWPVWTYQQQLPPAKFVFDDEDRRGVAVDSMVSGGCIVSGARVARSLLFSSVRINSYAQTCEAVAAAGTLASTLCRCGQ